MILSFVNLPKHMHMHMKCIGRTLGHTKYIKHVLIYAHASIHALYNMFEILIVSVFLCVCCGVSNGKWHNTVVVCFVC